ncbi:MAG: hypothetical protein ACK6D7_22340, partial [Acidobacteriota bacterium]
MYRGLNASITGPNRIAFSRSIARGVPVNLSGRTAYRAVSAEHTRPCSAPHANDHPLPSSP